MLNLKPWTFLALALLLGLGACGTLVPAPVPDAPLRAAWNNAPAAAAEPAAWPARWWQQFHSTQLDALVDSALRDNPGLAAAGERLVAARLLEQGGSSGFRPGLALDTGSEPSPGAKADYFQAALDARWEMPLFERGTNGARILLAETSDAATGVAEARAALIAAIVRTYLSGRFAMERMVFAAALVKVTDQSQQRVAARVGAGLDEPEASLASRQRWREARLDEEEPRQVRTRSLEALAALLGQAAVDNTWIDASDSPIDLPQPPATLPAAMLRHRPDVQRAESAMERAAAQLGIARAELYPHISIEGALTTSLRLSGGGGISSILSAGPVITLPLFDWGLRRAQTAARGAGLRAATLAYRQTVLDAVAEAELAFAQCNAASQQVAALTTESDSAQLAARRASTRRELGLLAQVPALDLMRDALLARQALDDARLQQAVALVHLYAVLGAGTDMPEGSA